MLRVAKAARPAQAAPPVVAEIRYQAAAALALQELGRRRRSVLLLVGRHPESEIDHRRGADGHHQRPEDVVRHVAYAALAGGAS